MNPHRFHPKYRARSRRVTSIRVSSRLTFRMISVFVPTLRSIWVFGTRCPQYPTRPTAKSQTLRTSTTLLLLSAIPGGRILHIATLSLDWALPGTHSATEKLRFAVDLACSMCCLFSMRSLHSRRRPSPSPQLGLPLIPAHLPACFQRSVILHWLAI